MSAGRRVVLLAGFTILLAAGPAWAGETEMSLCSGEAPRPCKSAASLFGGGPLILELTLPAEVDPVPPALTISPDPRKVRNRSIAIGAGALVLTPVAGWLTWWSIEKKVPFNFANEGWFDPNTYTGGADKANHMIAGYFGQHALDWAYQLAGQPPERARWWALGTVALTGLAVEAGDGMTVYGASWEDALSNVLGAGLGLVLTAKGLDDTVGLRMGQVPYEIPPPCCRAYAYGADYSKWVHSADLKLAGFLPRIGVKPGPARFLLLSMTYGTKGYRFSPEEVRERNLGIDLGLNLPEILRAVGVRDGTWWGKPLLALFTYIRIPYTAFGWRYDFNRRRWHGPDTGDQFDPGRVIWD